MIDKFEDLNLTGEETLPQVEEIIKDKLGIGFAEMADALSKCLQQDAQELSGGFVTVACYGDYGKLIEGEDKIAKFFRQEACKSEHWQAVYLQVETSPKELDLLKVVFDNKAVNEGDDMQGYVFVSLTGVIRHVFVRGDP